MLLRLSNKALDLLFTGIIWIFISYLKLSLRKAHPIQKKILALPYYSLNYAGGQSRIADWGHYFRSDNIVFDVHWASESNEFLSECYSTNPFVRYWFFFKVLWRRVKILKDASNYSVIWIQRTIIPFYPYKTSYFEEILKDIGIKYIIDYYDADYTSNYPLTISGAKSADKVTVASKYLLKYFSKINKATFYIPYAIDYSHYISKVYNKSSKGDIIVGWMGSPDNFKYVLDLEATLNYIERKYTNVKFVFICRQKFDLNLNKYEFKNWSDPDFNYFKVVSSFDIGIAPMFDKSERNSAKTAFKVLEFMASGIAFIAPPFGIPEHLENRKNFLIAEEMLDWSSQLEVLLKDIDLRKTLGMEARKTLERYYNYATVYNELNKVLLDDAM